MTNPSRCAPHLTTALALGLLTAGCGGTPEAPSRPSAESPAAQTATTTTAVAAPQSPAGAVGTASITGKIRYDGTAPAGETVKLTADPFCAKSHPSGMTREDLVVGPGNGLANVFVYVKEGIAGGYSAPTTPVVLDQKGCSYHPHVFGVMVGQPIDILNSDETLHNVHAMPEKNAAFNQGMPVPGSRISKTFTKPEVMVRIKCDVHGWMNSWAGVLPHPFFGVSGPDGTFAIKGLPAGTYTIEAWHEKLGTQTLKVTVADKESKTADFAFKPSP